MAQKVRLAVIGTGWWGTEYHLPGIQSHPEAEIAAICDTNPARLRKAAEVFQVDRTYTDCQDLLSAEELDGVIIVTPHATHFPIATACQERGLHLLIEKPMTLQARHARQLVRTAHEKNLTLMVGYPYHYQPHVLRAREAIQSGGLGPVQYVVSSFASNVIGFLQGEVSDENTPSRGAVHNPGTDYNRPELLGGGQGHLQITHSAALTLFVTGLRARQVSARMNNFGLAVDLVDAMSVEFEGGAVGTVGGTANAGRAYSVQLSVYCRNGAYVSHTLARLAALWGPDGEREDLAESMTSAPNYAVTHNFIEVILGRAENGSPGEIGWRTVELLDAAYRSTAQGGMPVTVEELYSD